MRFLRTLFAALSLALGAGAALAQGPGGPGGGPGPQPGQPWVQIGNVLSPNGLQVQAAPSTNAYAGLNLPPGTAPTTPSNGDVWTTASGFFVRVGGTTYNILNINCPTCAFTNQANIFTAGPQTINLNAATAPAPDSGTLLQGVSVDGTTSRIELTTANNGTATSGAAFSGRSGRGTIASPAALQNGDNIVIFSAHGYDGTSWSGTSAGGVYIYAEGNWTNSSHPSKVCFDTAPSGGTARVDWLCVHNNGAATFAGPLFSFTGTGQASVAASTTNGAILGGDGSTYDSALVNQSGLVAVGVTTGTRNIVLGGTLTAASLSTSGTITGAVCITAAGLVLNNSSTNCFAVAASAIIVGTTTVTSGTASQIFYQNGASPSGTIGQVAGVTSNGTNLTIAQGDLILGSNSTGTITFTTANAGSSSFTATVPANTGTISETNLAQTYTAVQTFTNSDFRLLGSSTGFTTLTSANAGASNFTWTIPASTDTFAGLTAASQQLTGGALVTPNQLTAGTNFTVNCGTVPLQWILNNGNATLTITAPVITTTSSQDCAVAVVNGTAASGTGAPGSVTLTGFSGKTPGGVTFSTAATTTSTVTFSNGSSSITWTSHGRFVGDIVYLTTSGSLPTNFAVQTEYWIASVVNANTITLASTPGGSAITAGSAGSGTQTINVPSVFDLIVTQIYGPSEGSWVQVQ
jgi:hypothetical protein